MDTATEKADTPEELAVMLVVSIESALAHGTKHFSVDGKLLLTVIDVLVALKDDGEIFLEPVSLLE